MRAGNWILHFKITNLSLKLENKQYYIKPTL
jgi:hypothetical protein